MPLTEHARRRRPPNKWSVNVRVSERAQPLPSFRVGWPLCLMNGRRFCSSSGRRAEEMKAAREEALGPLASTRSGGTGQDAHTFTQGPMFQHRPKRDDTDTHTHRDRHTHTERSTSRQLQEERHKRWREKGDGLLMQDTIARLEGRSREEGLWAGELLVSSFLGVLAFSLPLPRLSFSF